MNTTTICPKSTLYSIKKRATRFVKDTSPRVMALAAVLLAFISTAAYAEHEAAGVVSMTIGKAYLNGNTLIKAGTELNEGDKIETLSNGHVYIKFVDNGLVSIRPDSQLLIEHYQYNPEAPSESVIKFDLSEGVMRSISGAGAKAARDKFRLNTPIAAIGVRGTDFVVKASSSLIQAVVNEGAIVVAPFSDACAADALGPCSENSVELTGTAKQLLEVSALASTPRLVPLSETFAAELKSTLSSESSDTNPTDESESSNTSSDNEDGDNSEAAASERQPVSATNTKPKETSSTIASNTARNSAITNTSNNSSVDKDLKNTSEDRNEIESLVSAYVSDSSLSSADNRVIPDNYVPEIALGSQALSDRKLTWGRWGSVLDTDRIVTTREIAATGKEITVGFIDNNSTAYTALYRNSSSTDQLDTTLSGSLSFNLVDAQATLTTLEGASSLMEVTRGSLNIDFSRGTFDTALVTKHDLLSSELTISAEGTMDNRGFLLGTSSDGFLKGATTVEGDAASYILHKDIDIGSIDAAAYFER